jgi:hypothetical protein
MTLRPGIVHHCGVMAGAGDFQSLGVKHAQHIEVNETVIQRRDQGVRHGMNQLDDGCLISGRVNDDIAMRTGKPGERVHEGVANGFVGGLIQWRVLVSQTNMCGNFQVCTDGLAPSAPVFDVASKTPLPHIDVDSRNAVARFEQSDRNLHGDGGFARAALLVADDDDHAVFHWHLLGHALLHEAISREIRRAQKSLLIMCA